MVPHGFSVTVALPLRETTAGLAPGIAWISGRPSIAFADGAFTTASAGSNQSTMAESASCGPIANSMDCSVALLFTGNFRQLQGRRGMVRSDFYSIALAADD